MSKNFVFAILAAIVFLGGFSYYIFVLGGTLSPTQQADKKTTADTLGTQTTNTKTHSSLKTEDITIGKGPAVKSGDTIVIDYKGTLTDGTKFDSSYDRGTPFETQIGVGRVIKGWDMGVVGMKVGGKRKLTIPPALGYGDQEQGSIPPNSTLIFEVELREIK